MATLKDVAKKVGVAPITVSRVINHPEDVKEETRSKIQKAMAELQYIPNVAARNLISKRSHIIDVYIPEDVELSNPFMMHLLAGVSETLSERMYSFLVLRNRKSEHICDGYIATGLMKEEIKSFNQYAKKRNRPVVMFGHTGLKDVDCIDVDNIIGAEIAVENLIKNGHRDIAMINVDEDKDYPVDRKEGYRKALIKHGCTYDEQNIIYSSNHVEDSAKAVKELFARNSYTAVFCATDTIAIGVEKAVAEIGLSVPEDISIVGFDGLGHERLAAPVITTVQQPVYEIGKMLAQVLIERLDGSPDRVEKLIEPTLLVGKSVKKL